MNIKKQWTGGIYDVFVEKSSVHTAVDILITFVEREQRDSKISCSSHKCTLCLQPRTEE
jgi:hypothetical protein